MSIGPLDILNEDNFFSKLVPPFEEIKSELHAILKKSKKWSKLISNLYLVYIDNNEFRAERRSSFLYISQRTTRHLYLTNSMQDQEHFSDAGQFLDDYAFRPLLRWIFIEELLTCATPKELGEYIHHLLLYNLQNLEKVENAKYIRLRYTAINVSNHLIALKQYKTNIIIPKVATLDATETVGSIGSDHKTGIDIRVLVTNRRDTDAYMNFDTIFDFGHLRNYLFSNFTSATSFYKQVLGISYEGIFDICYLIGVSSKIDIFLLKRQIVYLPFSDGNAFKDCMKQFLQICFSLTFKTLCYKSRYPIEVEFVFVILLS